MDANEKISDVALEAAYNRYRLDWMERRGYDIEAIISGMDEVCGCSYLHEALELWHDAGGEGSPEFLRQNGLTIEEAIHEIGEQTLKVGGLDALQMFREWENDSGFAGACWSCRGEFEDTGEYLGWIK